MACIRQGQHAYQCGRRSCSEQDSARADAIMDWLGARVNRRDPLEIEPDPHEEDLHENESDVAFDAMDMALTTGSQLIVAAAMAQMEDFFADE